ncbi:hypothetical protein [Mucilaginibacter sp.]
MAVRKKSASSSNAKTSFTLDEVRKLVKNAYEVGFCDGIDDAMNDTGEYRGADDFWEKNVDKWLNNEITYGQ